MEMRILKPRKALNKAFLKVKPNRTEIESFKTNLIQLLDRIDDKESEEFHKNLVIDFLKKTYYDPNHFVNTKGRNDLVIHNTHSASGAVGVIIEAKKPSSKGEMLTQDKINVKAFQELVLYYLRERITQKNIEIKYLIATNINEWFIFDAHIFEKHLAQNKELVRKFIDFENGSSGGKTTEFFYKQIAEPFIADIKHDIEFTWFDIREYEKPLRNHDQKDDNKLISLFKIFSPEHLLKLPFANDSNSLDKRFYGELLHIIGLTETKDRSKKLIERNKEGDRNTGSFLENAIIQLDSLDKITRLEKPSQFGANLQERLFNVGLELSITWINRILFLKLLEAQLITYHKGDKTYEFLSFDKIKDYDDLNSLFFQVLARKQNERNEDIKALFAKVPYLNSSLFEPTEIEHTTLFISNLRNDKTIPIYSSTVIKDDKGKKRTGHINPLEYLFEFLNAYDFASEGSEEIQEDNKSLINASVLGLIFEKINGYKDGSFFTPGFITMYMCRETIRKAVVQKFDQDFPDLKINRIEDIYEAIGRKEFTRKQANEIINSLKICDPAVGSGHFLVSALNELIAIKNDLKILDDKNGKSLNRYEIEVVNDELIVTDEDGELFEYKPTNKESQRIQETLFHEKQMIIENCLFGVDINPNSVKICRLRLWIELLKNAYYKNETELETLPNIDINIKCGNSLISRYALDADIKKALRKSKWTIDSYRLAVMTYRNARSKDEKRAMEKLISQIKSDFESEIAANDKRLLKLNKLKGELYLHSNQQGLFELGKTEKKVFNKKTELLTTELRKLETELEEITNNRIYENAFEWRFEFPEVLNDEGDFVGFDVVIGNPPYIRQEEFSGIKLYLQSQFETYAGTADLYVFFVERGIKILKQKGNFIYILPNKWMRAGYGAALRKWVDSLAIRSIVDFGDLPVFDEATTYPCIWHIEKTSPTNKQFSTTSIETLNFPEGLKKYINTNSYQVNQSLLSPSGWTLSNDQNQLVLENIKKAGIPLGEYVNGKIYRGVLTGLNEAFVIDKTTRDRLIAEDPASEKIIKPFLAGRDIKRYQQPQSDKYLIFTRRGIEIEKYTSVKNYLAQFQERLEPKPKDYNGNNWSGRKPGSYKWYEIQDAVDYFEEFEKEKIVWPETSFENQFCYVEQGVYLNKTSFFIPVSDHFLLGLLNSKMAKFYFGSIVSKMRGGYFSMSKAYVETFIVLSEELINQQIISVVDQILKSKRISPSANTAVLESQIDQLVYQLYDLTTEEIEIIENGIK